MTFRGGVIINENRYVCHSGESRNPVFMRLMDSGERGCVKSLKKISSASKTPILEAIFIKSSTF
jgi:hypothetical protein